MAKDHLNFIDISGYQKGIDLAAVFEKNDIDGVIVKATGGVSHVQQTCDAWVQWLRKNNKPWGFYHFLDDDYKHSTGAKEAEFFVKNCLNYFGDGLPCADYEEPASSKMGTDYLLEFLQTVYDLTGVKCAVYSNLYTVQTQDFTKIAAAGFPLWLAQYASNSTKTFNDTPWQKGSFAPFKKITMHQYSSNGKLNGYTGNLDLNRFYGTLNDWAYLVSNIAPINPVNPDQQTVIESPKKYVTLQLEESLYNELKKLFN